MTINKGDNNDEEQQPLRFLLLLRSPLFAATPPQILAQNLQRGIRFYRG
jgi:hypothetical protein